LNSLRPSFQFTMERDLKEMILARYWLLKCTENPSHTDTYLNFTSNHPPHMEKGLIQSLHTRASTICQEHQDLSNEISSLRCDFIHSVINSKGSSHPSREEKSLCISLMQRVLQRNLNA
jgi:hypothetical protein